MAQKSGEDVKADGHGLQAEELHDQVVARGHEHHADRGEKQQGVILAVIFVFDLQVAHRQQNHQRRGDQENHPEKQEEGIHHDRAIESAHGVRPQSPQAVERNAAEDHAQHGEDGVAGFVLHAQHEIEEQDRQAEERELHLGQDQEEVVAKCGGIHGI